MAPRIDLLHVPFILALLSPSPAVEDAGAVDGLFHVFVGITVAALVIVHVFAIWALVRRRGTRAENRRWGRIVVTGLGGFALVALTAMFVASEVGWAGLKNDRNAAAVETEPQRVLVVGQRFAWSVVYPGDDNTLGRYLLELDPSDPAWPNPNIIDAETAANPPPFTFAGVNGPAGLDRDDALAAIDRYREQINPLLKDFDDPAGWDDDWRNALNRPVVVTADRPVEIRLGSLDAIHDFFVPAMRVKLDAVPGLLGTIRFTPTQAGEFTVLCAEFCGYGHTDMTGRLIVEAP